MSPVPLGSENAHDPRVEWLVVTAKCGVEAQFILGVYKNLGGKQYLPVNLETIKIISSNTIVGAPGSHNKHIVSIAGFHSKLFPMGTRFKPSILQGSSANMLAIGRCQ